MKVQNYGDMEVRLIVCTEGMYYTISLARAITMKQDTSNINHMQPADYKFLLVAEHTSLFEHASFTFLLSGISRSLLAQITRHRICSFTAGSQHYQDYSDYPLVIDSSISNTTNLKKSFEGALEHSMLTYENAILRGTPKEEARQVLPNAMAVNLLWTINARSLVNFLRLRLCKRNVKEMRVLAEKVWRICYDVLPELFIWVGPQCFMDGVCKQGKMSCGEKYERNN